MDKMQPTKFEDHLSGKEGQILSAAFHCIAEKGIAATSTYRIAAKAGLNQGVIHYYFKSKDELLLRVLEVFFQNEIANVELVLNSALSPMEKLETFLDISHSLIVPRKKEWIVFNAFLAHAMSVDGEMRRLIQRQSRRFLAVLMKILGDIEQVGYLDPGAIKDIAILMIGATQGLANVHTMDPQQFEPQRLLGFLRDMIYRRLSQIRRHNEKGIADLVQKYP